MATVASEPLLRPVGFLPGEISRLANRRVVQAHAEEAAFLWRQRNNAVRAPHYRLKHLTRLDRRVEGHLEGLRLGGDVAWAAAQSQLEHCDAGMVFVIGYLAFGGGDDERMRFALRLGLSDPGWQDALVSALAWHDIGLLRTVLERLDKAADPTCRRVALSAWTAHRVDVGASVSAACDATDPSLRARGLRAIGELKRRDLLPSAQRAGRDADAACRFWAGHSLALMGHAHGASLAFEAALQAPWLMRHAIELAMRCGEPAWARETVRALASGQGTLRQALRAAGAFGDPAAIPWLLAHMTDLRLARAAGEAFSMITGADLAYLDLQQDAPDEEPEDGDMEDADLPWPDPQRTSNWWAEQRGRFAAGERYLMGHRISAAVAAQVLREGYQRQRYAAAVELARLNDGAIVFPVAAPADRQKRNLAS